MFPLADSTPLAIIEPLSNGGAIAPGCYVIAGPRDLPSRFLRALASALARGGRVLWIDAGNSFDAYGFGYAARALRLDPRALLSRVSLARPFNVFQLETMVRAKVPARWSGEPIVVADPMPLFYDADLPVAEARRALAGVAEGMRAFSAPWIVLVVERPEPPDRRGFLKELSRWAVRFQP